MTGSDIIERLRDGVNHDGRLDTLHAEAVEAIQELRRNRNWWQHQAQAFSEHADNLRIMMLEGPRPTLTDAERLAVSYAADNLWQLPWYQKMLRSLLERLG